MTLLARFACIDCHRVNSQLSVNKARGSKQVEEKADLEANGRDNTACSSEGGNRREDQFLLASVRIVSPAKLSYESKFGSFVLFTIILQLISMCSKEIVKICFSFLLLLNYY